MDIRRILKKTVAVPVIIVAGMIPVPAPQAAEPPKHVQAREHESPDAAQNRRRGDGDD